MTTTRTITVHGNEYTLRDLNHDIYFQVVHSDGITTHVEDKDSLPRALAKRILQDYDVNQPLTDEEYDSLWDSIEAEVRSGWQV